MQRAIVVGAERARERGERPLRDAAAADQPPVGARRDHREVRLPPAERAMPVASRPAGRRAASALRHSAPETAAARAPAPGRGPPAAVGVLALRDRRRRRPRSRCTSRVTIGSSALPSRPRARIARVGALDRLKPAEDVSRLAHREPEIGPVERDVREADDRAAGRVLGAQPCRIGLNPWQRHARLHAPLHLDELDLHVDGGRQLGLRELELPELDHFS